MACDPEPRDFNLFIDLYESRVMLARHVALCHFDGSQDAAKQRIWKLKRDGYIRARPKRSVGEPDVLFLGLKGYRAIRTKLPTHFPPLPEEAFEKRAQVSERTLAHELAVMDAKVAFKTALKGHASFSLGQFCTWPVLHEFTASAGMGSTPLLVKPDGYLSVIEEISARQRAARDFFLELDRSSESKKSDPLIRRIECYRNYYRTGGYAKRLGLTAGEFEKAPFRVIVLCKSLTRRNNLTVRLLRLPEPVLSQVWLALTEEFTAAPLDAVWVTPRVYLNLTTKTRFDPALPTAGRFESYPERDVFIESKIEKRMLLQQPIKKDGTGQGS